MKQERLLLLLVILISFFALFFRLGDRSLENNDRILYAEVAREMAQSGEWVVLRHNGEIYLHKPPLLFWLMAIPAHIYGAVTPFIARLPSAISALLGIVLIFFLGKQIFKSASAGFLSSLVLLSCYDYSRHARAAQTDMLLCLFVILSLFLFYTSYNTQKEGKRLLYFLLSCASMGLGVMVKGPNGILVPVFTVTAFLAYKKDFKAFRRLPYLFGAVVFAAIILPWPIILCNKLGGFATTLAELQGTDIFTRSEAFYFYLVEIPKRFFPWSVFLPAAFFYFFSRRVAWTNKPALEQSEGFVRAATRDDRFFPLIWFVTMLVILSIPKTKNTRYILPAYPALALMVGGMWHYVLNAKNRVLEKWLNPSIIVSLIILLIVLIAAPVFFLFKYQYLFPITLCTSIIFVCAILLPAFLGKGLSLYVFFQKRNKQEKPNILARKPYLLEKYRSFWPTFFQKGGWSFAVITAFYITAQLIHVHAMCVEDIRHSPGRELAKSVSKYVKEDGLLAYKLTVRYIEPLNFYMNRVLPALNKQEDIYKALASSKPVYLIMQAKDYHSMDEDLKALIKFDKEVFFKKERLVIISNKLETTGHGY